MLRRVKTERVLPEEVVSDHLLRSFQVGVETNPASAALIGVSLWQFERLLAQQKLPLEMREERGFNKDSVEVFLQTPWKGVRALSPELAMERAGWAAATAVGIYDYLDALGLEPNQERVWDVHGFVIHPHLIKPCAAMHRFVEREQISHQRLQKALAAIRGKQGLVLAIDRVCLSQGKLRLIDMDEGLPEIPQENQSEPEYDLYLPNGLTFEHIVGIKVLDKVAQKFFVA